jgi:hypothetical protein
MPENSSFNLWQYKPWWCQPWTIILTGIMIVGGSWFLLKSLWLTIPVGILIGLWWFYFLILYPRLLEAQISQQSNDLISK